MRYVSTRGTAPSLDFAGVTLAGLASDRGLYVPECWPTLSRDEIQALAGLSYVDTAVAVMAPFVAGSLTRDELTALCTAAYGRFDGYTLPTRVEVARDDSRATVIIRRWQAGAP